MEGSPGPLVYDLLRLALGCPYTSYGSGEATSASGFRHQPFWAAHGYFFAGLCNEWCGHAGGDGGQREAGEQDGRDGRGKGL